MIVYKKILFNSTKLISNETLCLQCLVKINPEYWYSVIEFFWGDKLPRLLSQHAAFMQINKLSLNKWITALKLALKYCENLLSFRYAKDEITGYRHAQISHIATRVRRQSSKLLIFSRFSGPKAVYWLLCILTKSSMSAMNRIISRIQDRYLSSAILKFSRLCFWDSLILVHCRFNSYFMFNKKGKTPLTKEKPVVFIVA